MLLQTQKQCDDLIAEHGSVSAVARALGIPRSTLRAQITQIRLGTVNKDKAQPLTQPCTEITAILPLIKTGQTLDQLCDRLDRGSSTVLRWISELQHQGYNIVQYGKQYVLQRAVLPAEKTTQAHVDGLSVKIGVVSDTHLGGKYQQLSRLKEFYHICDESGVEDIFHAGDLVAGLHHRHDIFLHELQDQIDYAVENYPRRKDGKKTKVISGNHDLWAVLDGGVDPVRAFTKERDDVDFLGEYAAYVELKENVKLYLLHPDKGSSYADSYRLQKLIESFDGGEKPHIAVVGHYHRALYLNSRNVDGILAGCFESQTDFLRRKAIQPRVGGWIIEINFNENNTLRRFRPEFISWPTIIPKDY